MPPPCIRPCRIINLARKKLCKLQPSIVMKCCRAGLFINFCFQCQVNKKLNEFSGKVQVLEDLIVKGTKLNKRYFDMMMYISIFKKGSKYFYL